MDDGDLSRHWLGTTTWHDRRSRRQGLGSYCAHIVSGRGKAGGVPISYRLHYFVRTGLNTIFCFWIDVLYFRYYLCLYAYP